MGEDGCLFIFDVRKKDRVVSKRDMEMEYEENIKNLEELHAKQTQDLEASFQHKMMIEVGRYQKKAAEREREHQHWEQQHRELIEQHNRQVAESQKRFEE